MTMAAGLVQLLFPNILVRWQRNQPAPIPPEPQSWEKFIEPDCDVPVAVADASPAGNAIALTDVFP